MLSDPSATTAYKAIHTLFWAVRVTPGLQVRRLQRAFDAVAARHDTLRLRFVPGSDGTRVEVMPRHPFGVIVEDHGPQSEETITRIVTAFAAEEIPVDADALFDMQLLQFGEAGDVLVMRAQHAVLDGYGIALFTDELIKALLGLPMLTRPVSHADYLRRLSGQLRARNDVKAAFWANVLSRDLPPIPMGRAALGLDRLTSGTPRSTQRRTDPLSIAERSELIGWVRANGLSLYAHVYASFAETLLHLSGADGMLAECVVGRSDPALTGYIGPALQQIPVPVEAAPALSAMDRARRFAARLAEALEHLPYDFRADRRAAETLNGSDWGRYLVHMPFPRAQLRQSQIGSLVGDAATGGASFWNHRFKLMDVPRPLHCLEELYCNLAETDGAYELFLASEKTSFDAAGLDAFAKTLRTRLLSFRSD